MKFRWQPWLAMLTLLAWPARGIDLKERSESGTKQFIVFSTDVRLRQRVASYAEEMKASVLALLGERDHWKFPIVVTLDPAEPGAGGKSTARLHLVATPSASKVELNVTMGDDSAAVNFQKHLTRALLLEYAYRGVPVKGGGEFVEAPWWIVEGLIEMRRRRDAGVDGELFRRLVDANHLPPLANFLLDKPGETGPTALAVDRALAMCLLQMLVEQPGGHASLARFVRDWPDSNGDPLALLAREFPEVAANPQTLQKWWTVNLARFAAVENYQGLTTEGTDQALSELLQIELATDKAGEKHTFAVADYQTFPKLPSSRSALQQRHGDIVALGTRASAVMQPVMAAYEQIFARLARGKTRGLRDRIAEAEKYRAFALHRISDIADYLNWFEATQMPSMSGTFNNYLKTANDISDEDGKLNEPVRRYLDELEKEF